MATKPIFNAARAIKARIHFDPIANAKKTGNKLPTVQIPATFWGNLQPVVTNLTPGPDDPLPKADVLIITWTTAETEALSYIFTSNHSFQSRWYEYKHNSAALIAGVPPNIVKEPANKALQEGITGYYYLVTVNGKKVLLFKSEFHPADDGTGLPVINLVQQITNEVSPSLVISTGTAGASGSYLNAGDTVVTCSSCFYLLKPKSYPAFPAITNEEAFTNDVDFTLDYIDKCNTDATGLILPVLKHIAAENSYPPFTHTPAIFFKNVPGAIKYDAVSSNGFTMDDSAHTMGLQLLGTFNEMNDAFVAYALSKLPGNLPWLSIRNMSEPQAPDLSSATKAKFHGMYLKYGLYTTYNSALACWAVICGLV